MKGTKTQVRPGVWRLRVYIGRNPKGQPIQASMTFHGGSRAAENELRRFVDKVSKSRTPERAATLARLLDAWMEARQATPLTLDGDRGYIDNWIVPELGAVRLDRLSGRDLDRAYRRWLDAKDEKGNPKLSPSTVNKMHAIISAALTQAHKWEWVDQVVSKRATPPSRSSGAVDRSIAPDELVALIHKARADSNETLAMAVSLGAVTGARRGELLGLRWADVDFDRAALVVARSVSQLKGGELVAGSTKTKKARVLSLDDGTLRLLEWWKTAQSDWAAKVGVTMVPNPYILAPPDRPRGDMPVLPQTLSHQFLRLARKLKMPYHLHELRHFAATTMISSGVDPRMAATRLGHSRTGITLDLYAHAVESADRRAAELLGSTLPALP